MSPGGSIPFDRAAEVYDETRRLTPEASAATTELLADAVEETKAWAAERFGDFDRVLEPLFASVWRAYDLP